MERGTGTSTRLESIWGVGVGSRGSMWGVSVGSRESTWEVGVGLRGVGAAVMCGMVVRGVV